MISKSRCILFILISFAFTLNGQSDTTVLVPLTDIIDSFSSLSGIQFAYNPAHISKIEIGEDDQKIKNVDHLKSVLQRADIEYKVVDNDRWLLKHLPNNEVVLPDEIILTGYVEEDAETPLVGALIFTSDGTYGDLTDIEGRFSLEIPNFSDYKVCCQFLGYKVQCVDSKSINNNRIEFQLEPQVVEINEVTIRAKRLQFNIETITDSEKIRLAGSGINNAALGKDVLRSVQMLSGVDATNDLNSALSIRSSSQFQSLITLDGIPVYNPESAFGIFSALNPLVVQSSELYKNATPLEYGEFTGAYLSCEGLREHNEKIGLDLEINTLKSAAALQLPITKSTQISAAIRTANGKISNEQFYSKISRSRDQKPQSVQLFNRPLTVNSELENSFGDLYFNFITRSKRNETVSLSFFGNRDESGTAFSDEYSFARNNKTIRINEDFTQTRNKRNSGISLNYIKDFKSGDKITFLMYTSRYELNDEIKASVNFNGPSGIKPNNYRSTILNEISDSDLKFQYESNRDKLFSLKSGIDYRRINSNFNFKSNSETPLRQNREIPSLTPYLGLRFNYKGIYIIEAGARTSFVNSNIDRTYFSPRISSNVKINNSLNLKSSLSHNEQYFRPIEIERQLGQSVSVNLLSSPNAIPTLISNQATIGLTYKKGSFRLNGDFYLRKNDGIVEQILNIPALNNEDDVFGNNAYLRVVGENRVSGLDLSTSYEYKNFEFIGSYTYSKSLDRFNALFQNKYITDQNNRLHQVNFFGSYNYKNWNFSTTYIYGSGVYTLNREGVSGNQDRPNLNPNSLFKQLPAYRRIDVNISKEFNTKIGNFNLDFGIFNLTNHKNINSEIYIYRLEGANSGGLGAVDVNLLNRIWTTGIRYSL